MHECRYHSNYGPGGPLCVCCGPSPAERRAFERMVKRRVRQKVRRQMMKEIKEYYDEGEGHEIQDD